MKAPGRFVSWQCCRGSSEAPPSGRIMPPRRPAPTTHTSEQGPVLPSRFPTGLFWEAFGCLNRHKLLILLGALGEIRIALLTYSRIKSFSPKFGPRDKSRGRAEGCLWIYSVCCARTQGQPGKQPRTSLRPQKASSRDIKRRGSFWHPIVLADRAGIRMEGFCQASVCWPKTDRSSPK
jgi:hypothetical protein